jgi:hypothetical protein
MTPGARPQKKRLLWALSCLVVLILSGAVAFWAVRHGDRPVASDDCAVVEQLGQQWNAMVATINAQENGSGGPSDLTAIADARSTMTQKIRDAADHESSPTLRDSLHKWAEGSALAAKVQQNSATDSPGTTAHDDEDFSRAAVEVYQATSSLRQACPKMPLDPAAHANP